MHRGGQRGPAGAGGRRGGGVRGLDRGRHPPHDDGHRTSRRPADRSAPLAGLTGLRLSPLWPSRVGGSWFTVERARAVHVGVMVAFAVFAVVHVTLVASTGAVQALDHMFAARADASLAGVLVLVGVLALAGAAVAAGRPVVLRSLAGFTGRVTR